MNIGILGGTGKMGTGLAILWAQAGHNITLGSRQAERADEAAAQIVRDMPNVRVRGTGMLQAIRIAEVVVLAVPFGSVAETLAEVSGELDGKIVIDITNPFGKLPAGQTSAIEETARMLGPSARVIAAFKTNFWKTLRQPQRAGITRDCFICGNDEAAKATVAQLVADTGFRSIDCGNAEACRVLDLMVPLIIQLDQKYTGSSFTASYKLID